MELETDYGTSLSFLVRIMSDRCKSCQSRAQLIADVNEFEKEIKILGIPKAILSLVEFALQVFEWDAIYQYQIVNQYQRRGREGEKERRAVFSL